MKLATFSRIPAPAEHYSAASTGDQAMCYGQMLITHPNGCQQALPFRAGTLRLGSAPDNDLVIVGPGIAPYHATIRRAEHGDVLIAIGGQADQSSEAGLE